VLSKPGYPANILFHPNFDDGPTTGADGLSASVFPFPALLIRLNKMSTKHFRNDRGTSDLNLPFDLLPYFRFGPAGSHQLPKAEFGLNIAYIANDHFHRVEGLQTNLTMVGVGPTQTGTHPDLRMLVPAAVKGFGQELAGHGDSIPSENDFAVLILPTVENPVVELGFVDPSSQVHANLVKQYRTALDEGHGLGSNSAVWLQEFPDFDPGAA
jgi:hypothetical protein